MSGRWAYTWRALLLALSVTAGAAAIATSALSAQSTIRLYPNAAPGSERWSLPEELLPAERFLPGFEKYGPWLFNVSVPTLTVFRPDPARSNGTAVIVAPGGGFHFLSLQQEGEPIARWLSDRGITAFLLKYRVLQTTPEHRTQFFSQRSPLPHMDSELPEIMPLAVADGRAALEYVRAHAWEFGIVPTRVGMIGASVGATLVTSMATSQPDQPDFIALLYTHVPPQMRPLVVPKSAPPAFIAVASDDPVTSAAPSTETYNAWIAAGRSAELHVYAKGGHSFGMLKQGLPVDSWAERFEDWLRSQGLLTRPAQEPGTKPRLMTPRYLASLPYNAPDVRVAYGRDSSQFGELRLVEESGAQASANNAQSEADAIRVLERERVRALVNADMETAGRLHADDFQLVNPSGGALTKAQYLGGISSGTIDYLVWEPDSIAVRVFGQGAVIRYRSQLEIVVQGQKFTKRPYWHMDVYEKRDGRWQVVWSQATEVK